MNNDSEALAVPALETRYETLIRVSQAIGVQRDPEELFDTLADELHHVVPFNYIYLSVCDQNSNTFHDRIIDMGNRSVVLLGENLTPDERLASWVYEHQQPLLTSTDKIDPRYDRLLAILKRLEISSMCIFPLTTAHRKLGTITFGAKQLDAYSSEEVRFLSLVAGQIALAFDNALNFTALQRTSQELQSKNDRLQLLLDVTNQVVSSLELRDLLRAISQHVRRVMQCDYAGLSLPDAENKRMRIYALDFPEGKGFLHEELVFSIEGSPSGRAFRTMKPFALESPFTGWMNYPIVQIADREGLKSFRFLPLISRNRALGVLTLGRREENAFAQVDIGFLTQVANQIALAVENALTYGQIRDLKEQLSKEKLYLEDEIRSEMNFAQIIGSSASLRRVLKRVETVAPTDSTVLIYGETGTGKELIARAIHDLSPRRAKPFVKLNCAAIPTGLLESELFGHEKGAFTGAVAQRIGRFEVANGGTIFLDEIGEIPLELQTKLLRVLQEREFERLGSSHTLRTDARLIAATNRDLEAMVSEQKFRSDLFFRLNVFPVHVPPLRERHEDIALLVRHFAQQFSRRMNKVIETIPSTTMDALGRYHWPGNIRELQNVIERAVIISMGPELGLDVADLKFPNASPPGERAAAPNSKTNGALRNVLEETERQQILQALKQCNWVVAGRNGAAAQLGVKRSTLQLRMQKLGITRHSA
ncbi:MAG TPA: sigma 54-interacting transcriptional regulator [Candidatus Acidoferrum sp.]|nr:sigma 54-interacting transcriptional regulator [Candidatus Acidoferrum sp.]